jgi:arsenate reductase
VRNVLFLCTGNACRSQMAEGFARRYAPEGVAVYSAGTEPHGLDPRAVAAMREVGIDVSAQRSKNVTEVPVAELDAVITLCGDAAETCPVVLRDIGGAHWGLPDPARASGSEEEVAAEFARVRDEIERRVKELFGAA